MKRLLLFLFTAVICCGCAKGNQDADVLGRYVEEPVELPGGGAIYEDLVQEGNKLRLVDADGKDLVSVDGGESFGTDEEIPLSYAKQTEGVLGVAVSPGGSRLVWDAERENCILITAQDQEIEITGIDPYPELFLGGGYFYIVVNGREIYQVDPADGSQRLLLESEYLVSCLAAGERYLYMAHADGILLYDLEKGGIAEKQDEVLSLFVAENAGGLPPKRSELCMCPYGEGIYLLLKSGMYWHGLYSEDMELLVDGDICSMGNLDKALEGMAVLEDTGVSEKPSFLVCYSDGDLMRYTYDAESPSVPEFSLRIYSVYEDGNVRRAVSAFRMQYPEISILYETGVKTGYSITEQDALKNLATELAAGNGPDILVMDDIPYAAYLDKNILMDLSSFWSGLEGAYFNVTAEAFRSGDGLYAIPMSFFIPVLCGEKGKIEGTENLSELAELLEAERKQGTAGPLIGFRDAESALRLLSQSSQGAWMKDGGLDRESVAEFLVQAKRIYDVQMEDPGAECDTYLGGLWAGGHVLKRRFGKPYGAVEAANHAVAPFASQPFVAGYMSGAGEDYRMLLGELAYKGEDFGYCLMPGQQYGACLAVSVLSVNDASENKENAEKFLEFALSEAFQGEASLNGTPFNKAAYYGRQVDTREEVYIRAGLPYSTINAIAFDGTSVFVDVYWPTEEQFQELDSLLGCITGVNQCDSFVYENIIEQGQKVLTGEAGIEEAVEEIGRKVQIYLAE